MINVFQWTYGVFTITDDKSAMDIGKVFRNPTVLAVIAGLILFFLEIPMPSILDSVFDTIGGINTPLAMFSSGVYLARSDLLGILKKGRVYLVCAVRLLVIPLVTILLMKVFPWGSTEMKMSILCAAACPVGVSVSIFAQQYGKDYTKGVEYVSASTLLCIITIPVIVFIATKLI
jgi:predicted permease